MLFTEDARTPIQAVERGGPRGEREEEDVPAARFIGD